MRLIDRARRRPPAARAVGSIWDLGAPTFTQTYKGDPSERVVPTFGSFTVDGYQANAIVFAIILKRMSVFAEARLKFRDTSDGTLSGSQALQILGRPWPGATTGDLLARMEQDVSLAGNAFLRRASDDRLERMRPDMVDIVSADRNGDGAYEPVGYVYWRNGRASNDPDFYDVEQVAHWSPIPDPLAQWRGMSWLTPVIREINADTAMTDHKQNFLDNAATPNMAVKYPNILSDSAFATVRERWESMYSGATGKKTAILDNGADLTVVGSNFEQMAFTAVQAAGENRIAAAGGVPGIVVGLKEGLAAATYSNFEQAMRAFADTFLRPQWRSVCAALSNIIDVPDGQELWFDESRVAALRQGEKSQAETMQIQAAAAVNLISAGYEPESVKAALVSGDLALLSHTGLVSVQLQPPGVDASTGGPA